MRFCVVQVDNHNVHCIRKGMSVRVSNGGGWDHVSVSFKTRCPTWNEMCRVKDWVFKPEEAVMQIHPPKSDYRCHHQFCLHLWRPQTTAEIQRIKAEWITAGERWPADYPETGLSIPLPPGSFVAPESAIKP
jgi:hypothetical protein